MVARVWFVRTAAAGPVALAAVPLAQVALRSLPLLLPALLALPVLPMLPVPPVLLNLLLLALLPPSAPVVPVPELVLLADFATMRLSTEAADQVDAYRTSCWCRLWFSSHRPLPRHLS